MEKQRRTKQRKITLLYPETGPLRRELYPKHMAFLAAGAEYRERLALAANRVGKTEGMGLYEVTLHATGWYPEWWTGKRYATPPKIWVCGDSSKTVRDILQMKLLGPYGAYGTGLIPAECIAKVTRSSGGAELVDSIYVKHPSGLLACITLKSYEQGVPAFQGTEIDVILLDEEPPRGIYTECLMRTMTNNGIIMMTFTPLLGMSDVVMMFLPEGKIIEGAIPGESSRFVVTATWDDVPHLTQQAKEQLWASIPEFQRDARSKGVPQLGSGAIYQIAESEITIKDFAIPEHWPRAYGFDVGWNKTAALWVAYNPENDVAYAYSEYYRGQAEPIVHAMGVKSRGEWINGFIDPASRGRSQKDGTKLISEYKKQGLNLSIANNAVEAGIFAVWERMSTGRLKIFTSMQNTLAEYRLYRRDENGKVVKSNDHLMDALRYVILSGTKKAKTRSRMDRKFNRELTIADRHHLGNTQHGWMST